MGVDSSHPQYIYESWMKAELTRIARNSSGHAQWILGRRIFSTDSGTTEFPRMCSHASGPLSPAWSRPCAACPAILAALLSPGSRRHRPLQKTGGSRCRSTRFGVCQGSNLLWSNSPRAFFWRSERAQAYGLESMPREYIKIRVAWRLLGAPHSQSVRWLR